MTLIGCMAAWNEAELIGGAIESLWAIGCDRVIVVDGQWDGFSPGEPHYSTDGTQNVAASLGAEIIDPPGRAWHNQVEARSQYFVGKQDDWYLVCDADERCHGMLPDLTPYVDSFWVHVEGAGGGPLSPTRLFRHRGEVVRYHQRHYLVFMDGAILEPPKVTAEGFRIVGVDRQDAWRDALKAAFYPVATIAERGGDPDNPRQIMKTIPKQPLGPLHYIGGRAFIPGVPARDLTAWESDLHHAVLTANLASARPIYETVTPVPAVSPAESKPRQSKRRKE